MKTVKWLFPLISFLCLTALAEDRALIVGIERYADPKIKPSLGSESDADDIEGFLVEKLQFKREAILKLTGSRATSQNIRDEFHAWLIAGSRAGDRVFFYYSGHGSYLRDNDVDGKDEKDDGYDETIVPYDTKFRREGMIRDDQFSLWLTQLVGRRVVMIFDSCHSGTISRGVGSPGAEDKTSRYIVPNDEELGQGGRTRNLVEVTDGKIGDGGSIGKQSAVVVISAAGARQTAHSMRDGNRWRGALTRALLESYAAGTPTLAGLRGELNRKIRGWQDLRVLNGFQTPECEVSAGRLDLEPLFGRWEKVPEIAFINQNTKMTVTLQVEDKGKFHNAQGHLVYYENENISYRITTNTSGYLYLMAFSQEPETGRRYVSLLFPNKGVSLNNLIDPPGKRFPKDTFDISATGLDITVALVTNQKLKMEIKDEYSWDEIFTLINLRELQNEVYELTRGVRVKPRDLDWQAAALPIFTTKREK